MANPQRLKKIKRIKRIRKWKKRSLIVLCAFSFLILFLTILIYTNLGLKIITGTLEKLMPEIHFKQVNGSLNDLSIEGFSLDLDGVAVKLDKVELAVSGLCLIEGKICVKDLKAEGVAVNIDTNAFASDDETAVVEDISTERFVISMPLPLELRNADLRNVAVNVDDMYFGLSTFKGSATWANERIYVFSAKAMDVKALFPDEVSGQKITKPEPTESLPLNETIKQLFNKPLIASLPQVNIPLDIFVRNLEGDNWQLHILGEDTIFNNVLIQANTENNLINAKLVQTDAKSTYADAHIIVNGSIKLGDNWPINAKIKAKTPYMRDQVSTEIDGQFEGALLGSLTTKTRIKGLNRINVDAKIDFVEKYLPVTAKIDGKYIQWPLMGKSQYQLNDFSFSLLGSVKKYSVEASGNFKGDDLPDTLFKSSSSGTNESLSINNMSVIFPQGEFNLSGNIDWLKALKWDMAVEFENIDLSNEIPTYPIKLNGHLKTDGILDAQSWRVNLNDMALNGSINQAPLNASGSVAVSANQYISANHFNIFWGDNKLLLNGSTQKDSLNAHLDFPALNVIEKNLQGNIKGDLVIKGSVIKPIIDSHLLINNFIWQNISIDQALLTGEVKYQDLLQAQLLLKLHNLDVSSAMIHDANIAFSGDEAQHQLSVNIDGEPVSMISTLTGKLNKDRTKWSGILSDSAFSLNDSNSWRLDNALSLSYDIDRQQAQIDANCWINNQSKICLEKKVVIADRGEAMVSLKDIDLSLFEFFNEGETKLAGYVHGNASIKWDPNHAIPTIVANIDSDDVYVQQAIASQTLPIPFDLFTVNVDINDKQAKLDWQFSLKEFGALNGYVRIDEPTGKKTLNGKMNIDKLSLSIINPLLENNEHAHGLINANLKFSGTLIDPYIHGNIDLEHSEIKSSQLPADIKSIMIDVDFNGKSSVLKGKLETEAGMVNIDGKADWQDVATWNAYLTVNGAAINVAVPPMVKMTVIPDIKVKANQDQLDLTGKIVIPKGQIKVESLPPSSIDVSSDEVMLDNDLQEISPQDFGIKINSRVLVSLGEDVTIDAFGLNANLKGNVYVSQTDKGLSVNGQIAIPNGRFHAYGQDLIIRKGEILFAGPVDQPRLNIEAIRNPESIENNVTAGIRVTGLADEPKVEIFSDPAMSQQENLSYLLRGQGLDSEEQSDNDMMTALLIGLGTSQGGKVIGDIGNVFGIKDLSVDTQGVGDGQKVVVSGYILPHLQLKYGIGIFDSLATFTLRYRLLPRLYLEAASGLDQTVDLIYQFEF